MSTPNRYIQKQGVAVRARLANPICQRPGDAGYVAGNDDAHQTRRAEIQILRLYARKYPEVVRELVPDVVK